VTRRGHVGAARNVCQESHPDSGMVSTPHLQYSEAAKLQVRVYQLEIHQAAAMAMHRKTARISRM